MCQKYNDHVIDLQKDNMLLKNSTNGFYDYYSFTCGDGVEVKCVTPPCKSQCLLFKGLGTVTGTGGVAAIRNVTFIPNYQSPIKATATNLDFMIAFYHAGTLVSASLINGYTIRP